MRLSREELQKKLNENNCKYTMSWSRLNQYREDKYSFYLKVLKKIPEEKTNSYAILGSCVHDGLEHFYDGTATRQDMIDNFINALYEQSMSETNFLADAKRNANVEDKYKETILHFLHNYQKIDNSELEVFVGIPLGHGYYLQGYIDHIYPEVDSESGEKFIIIEDFKTSTLYSGKKIQENSGQLKLYAHMVSKNYNIPLSKIKTRWNFLKYVSVDIEQKNGSVKTSKMLRNEIPSGLKVKFLMWAKAAGYTTEQSEEYFNILVKNADAYKDFNLFEGIPEEISCKFKVKDCLVDAPCDDAAVEEFLKGVDETISDMSARIEAYKLTQDEKLFWVDVTKENSFYFVNLCGYTVKYHKPLRQYYETLPDYKMYSYDKEDSIVGKKTDKIDDDVLKFLFGDDDEE